jgi:hypothetical protein
MGTYDITQEHQYVYGYMTYSCVMSYVPIYLLMYLCYVIYPYTEWCSYVMSYTHIHIDVLVLCHMYPYTYWCSCVMSYTHIHIDVLMLCHIPIYIKQKNNKMYIGIYDITQEHQYVYVYMT